VSSGASQADDAFGTVALVTGAGSGIGAEVALELARHGARLAVCDIDPGAADDLCDELHEQGADAVAIQLDVGDSDSLARAFDEAEDYLGPPSVVVAAAAIGSYGTLAQVSDRAWRHLMRVDLDGTFFTVREAARRMRRGGSVVLIASDRGLRPEPGWAAYSVAKAGVIHLGRVAAAELAREGIRVNVVCPGPTATPLLEQLRQIPGLYEQIASRPLLGRLAQPGEIASAVTFCALHRFMTGSTLVVDGGVTLIGNLGIRERIEHAGDSEPERAHGQER
jgi:2-hydroxycyclohexanecarboxyl-CoA dehydrogenase